MCATPSERSSAATSSRSGRGELVVPPPQLRAARVDAQLAARLRVDEPEVAEVGERAARAGSRISTAITSCRAARRSSCAPPVARAAEVRDHDHDRAPPRQPPEPAAARRRATSAPAGSRSGSSPQREQERQHARRCPAAAARSSASRSPKVDTPRRLPRRAAKCPTAMATPSATSDLRRSAVPKRHRRPRCRARATSRPRARRRAAAHAARRCGRSRSSRCGGRRRRAGTAAPARARRRRRRPTRGSRPRAGCRSACAPSARGGAAARPGSARARACGRALRAQSGWSVAVTRPPRGPGRARGIWTVSSTRSRIASASTPSASAS